MKRRQGSGVQKKRRKGYQKMNGHRQSFTKVMINIG
jgi:ribosomal protein L21